VDEERARHIAQLKKAYEAGILDDDTYRTLLEGLGEGSSYTAEVEGEGNVIQGQDNVVAPHGFAVDGGVVGDLIAGDSTSITHITTVYQHAPGTAELDNESFQKALGRYLAWVEKRYGRLDLRGVERRERTALSLTLDDVYVSLAIMVNPQRQKRTHSRDIEEVEPQDIAGLLALGPRLVVTGGPGSGKTTYMHLIAATLARALRTGELDEVKESFGLDEPLPLPILIPLSAYNRYRRLSSAADDPRQGTLADFINRHLIRQQAALDLPRDFFNRLLLGGRECLLLLDGLDEVADERERVLVSRAVENLAFHDGVRQVLVTSRTRAYQGDAALALGRG
jgi:hypothetical protein